MYLLACASCVLSSAYMQNEAVDLLPLHAPKCTAVLHMFCRESSGGTLLLVGE